MTGIKHRLERFGKAMVGTGSWEAPGAILNGAFATTVGLVSDYFFYVLSHHRSPWERLRKFKRYHVISHGCRRVGFNWSSLALLWAD